MTNTIQTVWKLILDEQGAKKSEDEIVGLAEKAGKLGEQIEKIGRQKSLDALAKEFGALALEEGKAEEAAIKLNERLKEIGATDDEIKGVARTFGDASRAADDSGGGGGGGGGSASGLISKFGGVGRMAGINVEQIAGIARAAEGVQELATAAGVLGGASEVAGVASAAAAPGLLASAAGFAAILLPLAPLIIAIGAVVAILAVLKAADDQRAKDLKEEADLRRAISDEIAAGATSDDLQDQIEKLKERATLEKTTLEDGKKAYDDYLAKIRSAFGGLGALLEPFIKLFGAEEQQLADNVNDSQKIIDEAQKGEDARTAAIKRGDTANNDAKKHEEELADARKKAAADSAKAAEKSQHDQEQTAAKQQAAQEKAASEQQRLIDQQAQKEQAAAEKRYQAGVKYSDALVDIAHKAADDAVKALESEKDKLADNQRGFQNDIADLSVQFHASEREEAIKRGEQEVQDAVNQTRKLEGLRDEALDSEQDSLRKRDFLSATKIREAANERIQQENKAFKDAQADKQRAQSAEDSAQLRQLDAARHTRLQALDRANDEAKLAYTRDLRNQKEASLIAAREAKSARDRELRNASDVSRAILGIKQQQGQAELQLAQHTLNQLKGVGNTTNNNGNTVNGGLHFNVSGGAGGMTPTQVHSQILTTLGSVGLA